MRGLIDAQYAALDIDQDLALGMMLWLAHFFPDEDWAKVQTKRARDALEALWIDPPGYFGRSRRQRHVRIAFANYGVSLGLQAAHFWPERAARPNAYFEAYPPGAEYDTDPIPTAMAFNPPSPAAFPPPPARHTQTSAVWKRVI